MWERLERLERYKLSLLFFWHIKMLEKERIWELEMYYLFHIFPLSTFNLDSYFSPSYTIRSYSIHSDSFPSYSLFVWMLNWGWLEDMVLALDWSFIFHIYIIFTYIYIHIIHISFLSTQGTNPKAKSYQIYDSFPLRIFTFFYLPLFIDFLLEDPRRCEK